MFGDGEAEGVAVRIQDALADDMAGPHETAHMEHLEPGVRLLADLVGDRAGI